MITATRFSTDESQVWCRRLMFVEAKRFYFASRFLPRAKRRALEALYGVFRCADDLADEPGLSEAERRAGLAAIRRDLINVRSASYESAAAWFPAVRAAFARYPIDIDDAVRVIEGCEAEVNGAPIGSIHELERRAGKITGGVGRGIVLLGASDPDSLQRAERVGIAMQLTNILRDVERDRSLGRDYLAFSRLPGQDPLAVKRRIAARAYEYYAQGNLLAARLPNDGSRVTILLAVDLYRALLQRLERNHFDPSLRHLSMSRPELLWRALCTNLAAFGR